MCLLGDIDEDSHDMEPIFMRGYNYYPNHQTPNRRPIETNPITPPAIDPEVIKQMREAGFSESQILEQIDNIYAQKIEEQQILNENPYTDYDRILSRRTINTEPYVLILFFDNF